MCAICAAIPAAAAIGAKLNTDQIHKEKSRRLPVLKLTAGVRGFLVIASVMYHTMRWES